MKRNKIGVGHILKSYYATSFIGHSLLHRQKERKKNLHFFFFPVCFFLRYIANVLREETSPPLRSGCLRTHYPDKIFFSPGSVMDCEGKV